MIKPGLSHIQLINHIVIIIPKTSNLYVFPIRWAYLYDVHKCITWEISYDLSYTVTKDIVIDTSKHS